MKYFYAFQNWLFHTSLYQSILSKLPSPFNNIYFDSLLVLGLAVYLVYRFVEAIRIIRYRKRLRRKQADMSREQCRRDQEVTDRERQVKEKEERISRFLDHMECVFTSRMRKTDASESCGRRERTGRIGQKRFLLDNKARDTADFTTPESIVTDYDDAMDAFSSGLKQEQEVREMQEQQREQLNSKLKSLDITFKEDEITQDKGVVEIGVDRAIEKRKEKARKEEEKERKRYLRRLRKKGNGEQYGNEG